MVDYTGRELFSLREKIHKAATERLSDMDGVSVSEVKINRPEKNCKFWSIEITVKAPYGDHTLFDPLVRDPSQYQPVLSLVDAVKISIRINLNNRDMANLPHNSPEVL